MGFWFLLLGTIASSNGQGSGATAAVGQDADGNLVLTSVDGADVFLNGIPILGENAATNRAITALLQRTSDQAATIAAQNSTIAAQNSKVGQLENTVEAQGSVIEAMLARLTAVETAAAEGESRNANAVATLQANATDQAATIASLRANITTVAASAELEFCGTVTINTEVEFEFMAPYIRNCAVISNLHVHGGGSNATQLASAFANLRIVTGNLEMNHNQDITSLEGAFPQLVTVAGAIQILYDRNLVAMDEAFPRLERVGTNLDIYENSRLTTIGSSFGSLRSVGARGGGLYWYENGHDGTAGSSSSSGSRSFCASARAVLCPTTTSYRSSGYADDAVRCCGAYCASSADC